MRNTPQPIRAEPNVTPMIDVMLVLLIIFMAVGPSLVSGFRAVPPTGMHLAAHPDEPTDAVIGIDAAGQLYFNRQQITEAALKARLIERFRLHGEDRVVYLRADGQLAYSRVQATMELASANGARVVGLVSELPPVVDRLR
jgi:biopolymer transport protein TolR